MHCEQNKTIDPFPLPIRPCCETMTMSRLFSKIWQTNYDTGQCIGFLFFCQTDRQQKGPACLNYLIRDWSRIVLLRTNCARCVRWPLPLPNGGCWMSHCGTLMWTSNEIVDKLLTGSAQCGQTEREGIPNALFKWHWPVSRYWSIIGLDRQMQSNP